MERRNFLKRTAGTFAAVTINAPDLREQESLPSFEEMAADLPDNRLCLGVEGDGWRAIAHPDIETTASSYHGSPFPFRVEGNAPSRDVVGELLSSKFDAKVDAVYEKIMESDDPLETIMDLDSEELMVSKNFK